MLTAMRDEGFKVYAFNETKGAEKKYYCEECNQPLILKKGLVNTPHFAHLADYDQSTHLPRDPELCTEWHMTMARRLYSLSPDMELEKVIGSHRADVWNNKLNFAIEIQHSKISDAEVQAREDEYKRVFWVLDGSEYFPEVPKLSRYDYALISLKNTYFLNNSKMPILVHKDNYLYFIKWHDNNNFIFRPLDDEDMLEQFTVDYAAQHFFDSYEKNWQARQTAMAEEIEAQKKAYEKQVKMQDYLQWLDGYNKKIIRYQKDEADIRGLLAEAGRKFALSDEDESKEIMELKELYRLLKKNVMALKEKKDRLKAELDV